MIMNGPYECGIQASWLAGDKFWLLPTQQKQERARHVVVAVVVVVVVVVAAKLESLDA